MKIKSIIAIVLALLLTSCVTFDGYRYTLEDVRQNDSLSKKHYKEYDYLFTAEDEEGIADFIIRGDSLIIVRIEKKTSGTNTLYNAKSTSTYDISSYLQKSLENPTEMINTGKFMNNSFAVEFIMVYADQNAVLDGYDSFEFIYDGRDCVIYYKIVE